MSIGAGVVKAVALQQVDNAPNAEARVQRDKKVRKVVIADAKNAI